MQRRDFFSRTLAGSMAMAQAAPAQERNAGGTGGVAYQVEPTIERRVAGKPHQGKMLAAIQPHCDDIPIFAGGTVLKLLDEGYRGILITVSDDSMAGEGSSYGDIVLKNENDTKEVAKRLGLEDAVFMNYPNHNLDAWPIVELRARLIFLFRAYKVDTVLVYDPSGLYERNPDHYIVARAVESACWMARAPWDYPEHFKFGLTPHGPQEKYYFARGPQIVNRVVDIADFRAQKIEANLANVTQGPAGNNGAKLRAKLAAEGKRLPLLGDSDDAANRAYTSEFALDFDRSRGEQYGLEYAEVFHYVPADQSNVEEYVSQNAVPL